MDLFFAVMLAGFNQGVGFGGVMDAQSFDGEAADHVPETAILGDGEPAEDGPFLFQKDQWGVNCSPAELVRGHFSPDGFRLTDGSTR
jgi:hypothetical protein